eukprot:CAMPEP_0177732246 /NCGR_PEP_ID=MMETSP0484_2-20121128/23000_1 /TAXON_ID=354590 /ORGANISM="Rhodomonas lens, Strain RHODO" /LENGTH=107 /DNA_ID=CAMNT_0019245449 /DNA_START=323 /DNA_END=646 /DNA_ORIENTATION=+
MACCKRAAATSMSSSLPRIDSPVALAAAASSVAAINGLASMTEDLRTLRSRGLSVSTGGFCSSLGARSRIGGSSPNMNAAIERHPSDQLRWITDEEPPEAEATQRGR